MMEVGTFLKGEVRHLSVRSLPGSLKCMYDCGRAGILGHRGSIPGSFPSFLPSSEGKKPLFSSFPAIAPFLSFPLQQKLPKEPVFSVSNFSPLTLDVGAAESHGHSKSSSNVDLRRATQLLPPSFVTFNFGKIHKIKFALLAILQWTVPRR